MVAAAIYSLSAVNLGSVCTLLARFRNFAMCSMSNCLLQAERPGGGLVAVKALSLRSMADWKQLELFEREAAALRGLSHPGIPAYKDYFEVDSDGDRAYFLVQVSKAAAGHKCCMCVPRACVLQ